MNNYIKKAPIIGLIRYSQFVTYGKKTTNVFEADYFEYRYNIFLNVTLKSFQQQTNKDFILLLLHSENMPADYKTRFLELEKANSFLYNVFSEDTPEANKEAIRSSKEYAALENDVVITFRIDNDDAVQNDFIERLNYFLKSAFFGYAISTPALSIVKRISEKQYIVEEQNYPSNSIGLAYVSNTEQYKTIMELGHHALINKTTPMVLSAERLTKQLQTINGENEMNVIEETKARIMSKEDLDKYLEISKMGNLELNCLRIIPLTRFSYKEILKSLIPPLFITILRKNR